MHRRLLALLVIVALLVAPSTALAQRGSSDEADDRRQDGERGRDRPDDEAEEDDGSDARDAPRREDRPPVPVGAFGVEPRERAVSGEYVSFAYSDTGIQGFTARGTPLFDLAVLDAPAEEDGARTRVHGAEMLVDTPAYTLKAHDNPGAVLKLETDGTSLVTFTLDAALSLVGTERARFQVGNLSGTIKGDALSLEGRNVTSADGVLVYLDAPRGDFDRHRPEIGHAIGQGHVGAEMSLNRQGTDVQTDVVSYGNVTMTTVRAERGNLTLLIEGHGTEGRVLVLNVDPHVVGAERKEDLDILLDNLTIPQADDVADILDPDNDGYTPEYYVVFDPGADAFQLLVSVPHYSVHTLSVTMPFVLPPPSVVIGIVAGLFVLVPSAAVLFRRPKA